MVQGLRVITHPTAGRLAYWPDPEGDLVYSRELAPGASEWSRTVFRSETRWFGLITTPAGRLIGRWIRRATAEGWTEVSPAPGDSPR